MTTAKTANNNQCADTKLAQNKMHRDKNQNDRKGTLDNGKTR